MYTAVDIDYYLKIKRKADAWDKLIELKYSGDCLISLTDIGHKEMHQHIKELIVGEV